MNQRPALYDIAARYRLDAPAMRQLQRLAGLNAEPDGLAVWLPRGVAVLAAALAGLGVVMWVAANWDTLGRLGQFALLQGLVLTLCLGALGLPGARPSLALLALLAVGGLLAYLGQTYQTGADPWQLFALWAVLCLPLCLGARSDALWAPWALVAMTAVVLWVQARAGSAWRLAPDDLAVHAQAWAAAAVLAAGLSPALRSVTGAGVWALRTAVTLAVMLVTLSALAGLFSGGVAPHYWLGLLVLGAAAAVLALPGAFEVSVLSAVALGLNALLVAGLGYWLLDDHGGGDPIGQLLVLGLAAAGLLAASVSSILGLARRYGSGGAGAALSMDGRASREAGAEGDEPPPRRVPDTVSGADDSTDGGGRAASGRQGRRTCRGRRSGTRLGTAAEGGAPTGSLDRTLRGAIAAGLLPADVRRPAEDGRPWPVVLLTALGAWLAAVPLLGVVSMLLGDLLTRGPGPYLVGALVLAAAVVILRSRDLPLFVEQLAVPALLVGIGSFAFGLFDDLSGQAGAAWLALVSLGLAAVIPRPWLRVLLGALAAGLCIFALVPEHAWDRGAWSVASWLSLHGALAAWVVGLWVQQAVLRQGSGARIAAALESIGAGWLLGTLAGLALVTGMTFLVAASLDPLARDLAQGLTAGRALAARPIWMQAGSTLLVLVATLWGARVWPGLRRPWVLGVGLVAAGLAWFLPNLGGVWLALVLTATTRRWRLAVAAALAAAWIIGSFYYQLQWPLATKALVLVGAGVLFWALAWLGGSWASGSGALAATEPSRRGGAPTAPRWAIALTALATLAVVNLAIWEKEALIAQGQPVFVELAPVDPRSLMQGDFMRLGFQVPGGVGNELGVPGRERRLVVARRDARGVAALQRPARPGEALGPGELLMELTPRGGRWILVSDAWYFKEGDAKRWEAARYGEFRVAPDGRALLVGLVDGELRRIPR